MSDTIVSLRQQIDRTRDLQSVVRTMKALAASNISQYERSVSALADYYDTVELRLSVCFRENAKVTADKEMPAIVVSPEKKKNSGSIGAVVFGSDQGLVGQFNDVIADYAVKKLAALPGKPHVWAVGERVHARLEDIGLQPKGLFSVPNSVKAITPLIGQILVESEAFSSKNKASEFYLFYNRPKSRAVYIPVNQRLLPLDEIWQNELMALPWNTRSLPEVIGSNILTLQAFIREYLFVSLFRACAESLASENSSRLAAMQRADKNIDDMLEDLQGRYYRLRQSGIDEELFEVVSGFEAMSRSSGHS